MAKGKCSNKSNQQQMLDEVTLLWLLQQKSVPMSRDSPEIADRMKLLREQDEETYKLIIAPILALFLMRLVGMNDKAR
jgi:hypothetical protein